MEGRCAGADRAGRGPKCLQITVRIGRWGTWRRAASTPEPSRRSVLHGAAGLAGAGLAATVMAGTLVAPASASAAPRAHPGRAAGVPHPDEPVIVHIRDVRSGEMDVFAGRARSGCTTRAWQPGSRRLSANPRRTPRQVPERKLMSSHREAPEISRDPVADSTDLYAFVSPDQPDTVTLIANYIPLQEPAGGPNFYSFGETDAVRYEIHVDNDGDGLPDVTYRFDFETRLRDKDTFLYNTGPITSLDSPTWNNRQFYTVRKVRKTGGEGKVLATNLPCPPCNIGPLVHPRITPSSPGGGARSRRRRQGLRGPACRGLLRGPRRDLRPGRPAPVREPARQYGMHVFDKPAPGVNGTNRLNVHSIAIQVPITDLVRKGASGEATPNR